MVEWVVDRRHHGATMVPGKVRTGSFRENRSPLALLGLAVASYLAALPRTQAQTRRLPIASDVTVMDTVRGNGSNCYVYSMDGPTTKAAVYWGRPKLYVRLEPCTGLPHLKASVYGCPSEGHTVNWEFQNGLMRNDLRSMGRRVPPEWEWPGDLETLDFDATHKTFYIEVLAAFDYFNIHNTAAPLCTDV